MPHIIRVRKDIIDQRPIRVYQGSKSCRYRWKMMALLELNENGEYVLPFSQRLAHVDRKLWPRREGKSVPSGYEECGCIGCENKSYADHILKDDDDNASDSGNYHLEEVYIESDNEEKDRHDNNDDDFHHDTSSNDIHNNDNINEFEMVSSTTSDIFNTNDADENCPDHNEQDNACESMSITSPASPFPCDRYESMSITPALSPFPCDTYESDD